jgi:hypothetical protein
VEARAGLQVPRRTRNKMIINKMRRNYNQIHNNNLGIIFYIEAVTISKSLKKDYPPRVLYHVP